MKVELTDKETKEIENALKNNPVHRWFNAKENMKFEIGDILIKLLKRHDYTTSSVSWVKENINSDAKMAQRYVYIYEDEYGIGYVKRLKVSNGQLGKELCCMTDFNYTDTRFEVDPEYAEHVLLDADFDIKSIHKKSLESRKIIASMNRKIGVKPKTLKDFNNFFSKLKVGDTFYTSGDYVAKYLSEYTITSMGTMTVAALDKENSWDWRRYKERCKAKEIIAIDDTTVCRIKYKGSYGSEDRNVTEFYDSIIYTQKPAQEDKAASS